MADITKNIKISELDELTQEEFTGAEMLVLDTGTATKKMQVSDFNRASSETATAQASAAAQSATEATEAATRAETAAQRATDNVLKGVRDISDAIVRASGAADSARSSAETARTLVNSDYALTSRSYAVGDVKDALGNEYREGQSTDNAKYYAEQAKESETNAALSVNDAKNHKLEAESAKAAANNFKETAREYAIQAKESAQQAQENAAGATVFTADTDGLVPASGEHTEDFLKGNGDWVNLHEHRMLDCGCVADGLYKTTGDHASGAISKGDIVCAYDPDDSNHTGARLYEAQGDFANGESLSITGGGGFNLVTIPGLLNRMKTSFQDGVDTIYNACTSKDITPLSSTPEDIASAIAQMPVIAGYGGGQDRYSKTLSNKRITLDGFVVGKYYLISFIYETSSALSQNITPTPTVHGKSIAGVRGGGGKKTYGSNYEVSATMLYRATATTDTMYFDYAVDGTYVAYNINQVVTN